MLNEEDKRGVSENLNEEDLAIFDILTKLNIKLSRREKDMVKEVVKDLLNTLKTQKLMLDWCKRQQTRAAIQVTVEEILEHLPPAYGDGVYKEKCSVVYQHVYDAYYGPTRSVYSGLSV